MNKLMGCSKLFLSRNASTILTCVGGAGVVITSVLAVKATPKAMRLLKEARDKKGEDLTNTEIVKVAAPAYVPAVVVGASTIACIFGANVFNKRHQAAITSAYALLDSSYKEYKKKVEELYGEDADEHIKESIAKDTYEENHISVGENKQLFYDYFSDRYFESTMETVLKAEYELNRLLNAREYAYVNEFYEFLDIPLIKAGFELGWSTGMCYNTYWRTWIDFEHKNVVMDDGLECCIITILAEPTLDFQEYC